MELFNFDSNDFEIRTEADFRGDAPVINSLYDVVVDSFNRQNVPADLILDVFNNAYYICWLTTAKGMTFTQIFGIENDKFRHKMVRDYSYNIAKAVLLLHSRFYKPELRLRCTGLKVQYCFVDEFVNKNQGKLSHVICFNKLPKLTEAMSAAVKVQITALQSNFEDIEKTNTILRSQLTAEINRRKREVADLEAENSFLKTLHQDFIKLKCNNKSETATANTKSETTASTTPNHADPLYDVVNCDTLTSYAKSLCEPDKVDVIKEMLSKLSRDKRCFDEKLLNAIDDLERHAAQLRKPQQPIVNQNNSGCQQFYGPVNNSDFRTPNQNDNK